MTPATESWNLYLDRNYQAVRWPWPGTAWEELTPAQAAEMPGAIDDFTRYSPADGTTDMAQVPADMPREAPVAATRLAIYHDEVSLYVFIDARRPARPIPELADVDREDFSCVIPLDGPARGIYCGMNEKGESIACVQIWDADLQPEGFADDWPFRLLTTNPGDGPSASVGGVIRDGFSARVFATPTGLIGAFYLAKRWFARGLHDKTLRLSAGRFCYATAELLSWGSPLVWSPRPDQHGAVRLVKTPDVSAFPQLDRLDLHYDPTTETGEVVARWRHATPETLGRLARGGYAKYVDKVTLALNGREAVLPLAATIRADFPIADGWNRLEALTAVGAPHAITFQKWSGQRLVAPHAVAELPTPAELNDAFHAWHLRHEQHYLGAGTWGNRAAEAHCLCHDGIFNLLPYLFACRYLAPQPVYAERVLETCARMLANQHPDGWFPCYHWPGKEPQLGEGGAFANGSVGEGLALAGVQFTEPAWLEASIRAADYRWYRWEQNQNYAAFALWHLAALQQAVPRDEWLAKADYLAEFATRDLGPSGAQDGHNYYTGYGNITLKGMARLLAVLPPAHPRYAVLKDKTIRFTNQVLSRQQPGGLFAGRNRKYLGYHHPAPGLFEVAATLPELADALAPALAAMVRALLAIDYQGEHSDYNTDTGLSLALMARFLQGPGAYM